MVTAERLNAAQREERLFEMFASQLSVPVGPEAVALYLAAALPGSDAQQAGQGRDNDVPRAGRDVRRCLARLDLAARLRGARPWSESEALQHFLRGLHREIRIGPTRQRSDPLYREHVHHLVLAIMAPAFAEQRDQTALVLWRATGLPASRLATLRWTDITLNRITVTLHLHPSGNRPGLDEVTSHGTGEIGCPVLALRRLRTHNPGATGPVFNNTGESWDVARIHRAISIFRAAGGSLANALADMAATPHRLRDRALLVVGYGAALRTNEAIALRQCDVRTLKHGLLVHPGSRSRPVALPRCAVANEDPVHIWSTWQRAARSQGIGPDGPAFPIVSGSRIWARPMRDAALNEAVQAAVGKAALSGRFTFTSLRTGLIRTALRDNVTALDVAIHSDLRSLGSVDRHDHRENLIRHSVAGRLGL